MEAKQEGGDRAFARAARADQSHLVSGVDAQVESLQDVHVRTLRVVEMDVGEGDGLAQRQVWGGGVEVLHFAVLVDDVHHRLNGAETTLEGAELRGHAANASRHQPRHQQEGEEVLARQFALLHQICPFENHQRDGPKNEQDDEARKRAPPQGTAHGEAFDFGSVGAVLPRSSHSLA